jgi:hypothetical protein
VLRYRNVGLIGRARVGKDSVAARLSERHGYQRVAFADRLKEAALKVDPIIYQFTERDEDNEELRHNVGLSWVVGDHGWERAKTEYPEVRRFLQQYGQTARDLDPDFWVRAALPSIAAAEALNLPVVVTDVRYENEACWLLNRGFTLVRVTRPNVTLAGEAGRHKSETELADFITDMTIANAGTLSDLNGIVDSLLLPRT